MVHDVLVPLDGSPSALVALGPAAALAHYLGTEIHVVAFYGDDEEHHELASLLPEQLQELAGIPYRLDLVPAEGSVAASIAARLSDQPGRLAVMATRGRGRSAAVLGSVATEVLRLASGPLLLIGPAFESGRFRCHGPLVAATPHHAHARLILPTAQAFARTFDFDLELFASLDPYANVVEGLEPVVVLPPESRGRLEEDLQALARESTDVVGRPVTHHLTVGFGAARALVDRATETNAALIAMVTGNPTGLERVLLGSVTAEVIRRAPCPVLVLHPIDTGGADAGVDQPTNRAVERT